MQLKYLNKLAKRLKTDHIQMNPSSDAQFRTLHLLSNSRKLPEAYLEFMRIMGNGAKGDFLKGDSCFMDEIEDLKQGAEELLEENQSKQKLKEEIDLITEEIENLQSLEARTVQEKEQICSDI